MAIVIIDNYDSFTYNLVDYVRQNDTDCRVLRNQASIMEIEELCPKGILLSPGHGKPCNAGNLLAYIDHFHHKIPILGVCLGHQALGEYFGAKVQPALQPMHGKISRITCNPTALLFCNLPDTFQVVRYHSLVIDRSSEQLAITAQTAEQEIMAIQHHTLPIHGIQFHPEAILTENGFQLIQNWVRSLV